MHITREDILKELKKDGSLKNKTHLTKLKTPEQLYQIYNQNFTNNCSVCNKPTRFLNFKKGYDTECSRECRKEALNKAYKPDFSDIVDINDLKDFILGNYTTNVSNKLTPSFFINNNYIKELNTLYSYFDMIDRDISTLCVKDLHDIVYGIGICSNCSKETKFNGFGKPYRASCTIKCSKNQDIKNKEDLNVEFIKNKFILNNQFNINDMKEHFNVSESFVNKFKVKNGILEPNIQQKYTFGERILFEELTGLNLDVLTNSRKIINPYEIDIVVENLCIEFDGLLFHSDGKGFPGNNGKRFKHNLTPDKYQLLTIFENEFKDHKREIWLSMIKNKLGFSDKIHARKCNINAVSAQEAKEFYTRNHIQGCAESSVYIGLYYGDELVSLMAFGENKEYQWEMVRFCSKLNTSVIGAGSKLLRYFERNYNPDTILSFANKRWSNGELYDKLGFDYIGDTDINHFYFKVNENVLYTKEKFHGMSDSDLFDNGFRKIYDYGNKKYVKRYRDL